jgi:hypothetical protein
MQGNNTDIKVMPYLEFNQNHDIKDTPYINNITLKYIKWIKLTHDRNSATNVLQNVAEHPKY